MEEHGDSIMRRRFFGTFKYYLIKFLVGILAVGPIPYHIAFIMDGNRRYAKKRNLAEGEGHKAGFVTLLSLLGYCYEFGVKCVTVYAFSIDNFRRKPDEVQYLMDLMQEKIEELLKEESIVKKYGIRIRIIGNLKLLSEPVKVSVDKIMKATANNDKRELLICVAYTSTDEIVHAVEESCYSKLIQVNCRNSNHYVQGMDDANKNKFSKRGLEDLDKDVGEHLDPNVREAQSGLLDKCSDGSGCSSLMITEVDRNGRDKQSEVPSISLVDIEKHIYMGVVPDPDIVIRSGGEARLSNFLLWQTSACTLHSPSALWPELGLLHVAWSIIKFQRSYRYVEKKNKQF